MTTSKVATNGKKMQIEQIHHMYTDMKVMYSGRLHSGTASLNMIVTLAQPKHNSATIYSMHSKTWI